LISQISTGVLDQRYPLVLTLNLDTCKFCGIPHVVKGVCTTFTANLPAVRLSFHVAEQSSEVVDDGLPHRFRALGFDLREFLDNFNHE
jgi:hypothetical protein